MNIPTLNRMPLLGLIFTSVLVATALGSTKNEVFYNVGENPCTGVASESGVVDFLCTIPLAGDCANQTAYIRWYFASSTKWLMVTDGEKYGVWSDVITEDGVSSVLRVRDLSKESDIGIYTCVLSCQDKPTETRRISLCVQNQATDLIMCSGASNEDACSSLFANSECNENCDSEERLFDGGDCDSYLLQTCPLPLNITCPSTYADGRCDSNCNSAQCGYDGGDCLQMTQSIIRETLVAIVSSSPDAKTTQALAMQFSIRLATLVMLYDRPKPWNITDSAGVFVSYLNVDILRTSSLSFTMLQFRLVPQSCDDGQRCFHRVTNAVKYLSNHLERDASFINSPLVGLGVLSNLDLCPIHKNVVAPKDPMSSDSDRVIQTRVQTTPQSQSTGVGTGEIIGICLCAVALSLLIAGIAIACKYRHIAKRKESLRGSISGTSAKSYLDKFPDLNHVLDKNPSTAKMQRAVEVSSDNQTEDISTA